MRTNRATGSLDARSARVPRFGIGRADRPPIRRSNIVVAEPLVADDRIAADFVSSLGDIELEHVFMRLVERLKLAGDLGLLLRI